MEDSKIIELYFQRNENAIKETKKKYGHYCYSIAKRILRNSEDAAECENDTYLKAWNNIPPKKPYPFAPFLGQICRNLSLDRYRKGTTQKRGRTDTAISLSELEECIPSDKNIAEEIEAKELSITISSFLNTLPSEECSIFLLRYWHFYSIREICAKYGYSQSKIKMTLMRTREKLRNQLEKDGVFL